jgi:hypothetical protein
MQMSTAASNPPMTNSGKKVSAFFPAADAMSCRNNAQKYIEMSFAEIIDLEF